MNRLQSELRRLYLLEDIAADSAAPALIDAQGRVRAIVVELARSVPWEQVAAFWHRVQDDAGLPPPALAVSGQDGFQLWFSVAVPVPLAQALDVAQWLRQQYGADVVPAQLRTWPTPQQQHAGLVPAVQSATGYWSAFIVPGLGSMFADEPWLERAPSPEAQADLLQPLQSITPAAWSRMVQQCHPAPSTSTAALATPGPAGVDAYHFLHSVMNDVAVPLPLRMEAAKALLPYSIKPVSSQP
ncbi:MULTISPECIES: hypothetical protein [Giesbergeria]|uniref:Uncharacterized protein n=1 Tax=Giesbergeria sinuosa TaxID=80883 RepID=A0ABV9QDG3_9BURK